MSSKLQKAVAVLALSSMCVAQGATATQHAAKKPRKAAASSTASAATETRAELQQIRQMIEQQQQQINQLQQAVQQRDQQLQQAQQQLQQAQSAAQQAQQTATEAQTAANSASEANTKVDAVRGDVDSLKGTLAETINTALDEQKKMGALSSALSRFRMTGDVRVRYENFTQQGTTTRNRPRVRLRFGFEGKLNEDFVGGIAVASGATNDPTSTNSTLGDAFQRKPISFDRGYITFNPTYAKWLSMTGGKFAATWQKTNQTFDPDINPEGFSEKLAWDVKTPVVKNFSVTGVQLILNEANNSSNTVAAALPRVSKDTWAYGVQFGSKLQIGQRWTMTPTYMLLNFPDPNVLVNGYASLINGGQAISGSGTGTANVSNGVAPNGMTNSICARTIGASAIPNFCSKFLYSDLILNNTFKTWNARFPLTALIEYERNLRARANDNNTMVQMEFALGQTKNKGDFQVGYAYSRVEQDAVIASFAESDQRFPTNVLQNRLYATFKIAPNTTLGYTQWIGRALDTTVPNSAAFGFSALGVPYGYAPSTVRGGAEPWLKRGQLDLVYSF